MYSISVMSVFSLNIERQVTNEPKLTLKIEGSNLKNINFKHRL